MTRRVAIAVAVCLAASAAWGHTFPPVRTVVVQVERDAVVVMVGYRPGNGAPTDGIVARVGSQPKSQRLDAMREVMASLAMQPLVVAIDGRPLVPTSVRAKLGVEPGGGRPIVVVLVTYAIAPGTLSVTSREPRNTRISWQDRHSCRVDLDRAPTQDRWYTGVASFLLMVGPPCAPPRSGSSASPAR